MISARPLFLALIGQSICDAATPPSPYALRRRDPLESSPPGMEWLEDPAGGGFCCEEVGLDHAWVVEAARRAQAIGQRIDLESVMRLLDRVNNDAGAPRYRTGRRS